jgi:hypothetical protein
MRQLKRTVITLEAEWRQVLQGNVSTGATEDELKYWAHLGCWISPCYGPISLGVHYETYELFISLIFKFFYGPQITETVDNVSADTGA